MNRYVRTYVRTYVHTRRVRRRQAGPRAAPLRQGRVRAGVEQRGAGVWKGTNGVSTNGVTANFMFLTEGLLGYSC